ncbi:hypothetical protein D3C77_659230 [compost metagenome]
MVHAHHGAVLGQVVRIEVGSPGGRRVEEKQRQAAVVGVGHALQRFAPGMLIDDDRQHLGGEERAVVHRDHVQLVRQGLTGQGELSVGGRDDFRGSGLIVHGNTCKENLFT